MRTTRRDMYVLGSRSGPTSQNPGCLPYARSLGGAILAAITYNQPTTQSAWQCLPCKCLGGAIGGALGLWASGHDAGSQVLLDKAAAIGVFAEVRLREHNKTAIRKNDIND